MIRPWRVGILVDTSSVEEVRDAIGNLSGVWGGRHMPIFDIGTPTDELERLGRQYDVDSLYADAHDGPVGDLLKKPGWMWRWGGSWGPFAEEDGIRMGLLPTRSFIDASTDFVQPMWDRDDPAELVLAAIWGLGDRLGRPLSPTLDEARPRVAPYSQILSRSDMRRSTVGALTASSLYVRTNPRTHLDGYAGVYIIRPGLPADVVEFWNMRTYGTKIIAVPSEGTEELLSFLLSSALAGTEIRGSSGEGTAQQVVRVWGLEDATEATSKAIRSAAERDGLKVRPMERGIWTRYIFPGLRTPFTRSVRADFRPGAQWVDVTLPTLPIGDQPDAYFRGVVAADIELHSVVGQDPRFTASIPPYRRHSALLRHTAVAQGIDHARVTHAGLALGIDADLDHVPVPFGYNQDVMRLLFDDDAVTTSQSDIGKFQSRAAEKFGGPFSGVFNQPGTRAAVELAAERVAGVGLPHLLQVVDDNRGAWPDPFFERNVKPKEYARRQVNYLFHSGIFVPTLKIHCSHCRVERHASADDLAATMICEFCGQTFNLALSHSLTQPEWRYRLAAHLRADQVQALLPALAATSLLRQLRHAEEPPLPHMLGLEVSIDGRKIEVDVAAHLPDRDWTVVLGEVKTANRIDANDIANLEFLQKKLSDKDVRCLLLFATLKEELSPEEISGLRGLVERSKDVQLSDGRLLPNMPLILTGPDLSHPPGSENHPWRWDSKGYSGVFGTAITSCERNLGLHGYTFSDTGDDISIRCEWADN
ncbi:hypothetical protein Hesp01_14940 [Herbidospora sp. NBRC 101105]|nr:hypothetical protein Hesp01_14940 [Herbidospora sp. NBRC 101105]